MIIGKRVEPILSMKSDEAARQTRALSLRNDETERSRMMAVAQSKNTFEYNWVFDGRSLKLTFFCEVTALFRLDLRCITSHQ